MEDSSIPRISVVLPVYNAEGFIDDTFATLLAQDFEDFEVIAIDDGSTDGSWAKLQHQSEHDGRIRIFHQDNAGPGLARDAGMDQAKGEYLLFLDADDIYHADMLSKLYARAVESDADVTICDSINRYCDTGAVLHEWWVLKRALIPRRQPFSAADMHDDILRFTIGWPWDKLFKRSFIMEHAIRFPALRNSEDGPFVFKALLNARRIAIVDEVLIEHLMMRPGSVSTVRNERALDFYDAILLVGQAVASSGDSKSYARAFRNWAWENCLWNLRNIDGAEREQLMDFLAEKAIPQLGLLNHGRDDFFCSPDYDAVVLISGDRYTEFFTAYDRTADCDHFQCELRLLRIERDILLEENIGLRGDLEGIKRSKAYHLGLKLAKPIRAVADARRGKDANRR